MFTENQMKWISALRSGKYKQGKGTLRRGDYYCCLGVACEVLGIKGKERPSGEWEYASRTGVAPEEVIKALGLYDEDGSPREGGRDFLTRLNDDEGKTFEEIATLLETGAYFVNREPDEVD